MVIMINDSGSMMIYSDDFDGDNFDGDDGEQPRG